MSDLDEVRLSRWLDGKVPDFAGIEMLTKLPGGQSNPTYRLDTGGGRYVLRRKPFGRLLPSAHAVEREFRFLSALYPAGFPVPRPIALCEDAGIIGAAFYVMTMEEGRTLWNGSLPDVAVAERRPFYDSMIDTLAALHSLDYQAAGLGELFRPGNYFGRQVERWTRQYRAVQTDEIAEVEWLIDWLPRTIPVQHRTSIVHGDFRIDNLIYATDRPSVIAVIDWELATIGDPLADFAYLAMNWVLPEDGGARLGGINLDREGLPTLDEAVSRYCTAAGWDEMPDLHWYFAFNLFRFTGILQGIKKRIADGNASGADAATQAARIVPLARAGWHHARQAGATSQGGCG